MPHVCERVGSRRVAGVLAGAPLAARSVDMNLLGAPVLLSALATLYQKGDDGSTDGTRTIYGTIGVLVILALVIGIGQLMTGSQRSSR